MTREFTTSMGVLNGIEELNARFRWFIGDAEPSDPYPLLNWADTSTGLLKLRNADNTAWVTICKMSGFTFIDGSLAIEI